MQNVFVKCPVIENKRYLLRLVEESDAKDLLKVYSDKKVLPFFNSDNCNGTNFYLQTEEKMVSYIQFWLRDYANRIHVRFAIVDKSIDEVIGTIELFNRKAKDYFNNCGLLRLDLRSDYENQDIIEDILGIIIPKTKEMFDCEMIATKAILIAKERIAALEKMGFGLSEEVLVGRDGTKYDSYYVREV